jgi:RNA-directed DNA polymerase
MRALHDRIKNLLMRISLPQYLYCPRRGRAPVHNAIAHLNATSIVKLDVKQFYPSTTDEHIFQFFYHQFRMTGDVAGRITKLCTINGRVPFGSPLSPILCALAHNDVFSRVAGLCELKDQTMSLWVDDITISGDKIEQTLLRDIRRLITSKRMLPHKAQRASKRRGAVITGTFIGQKGPAPAQKSHIKMKEKLGALQVATSIEEQLKLARSLIGLTNYFITIYAQETDEHSRLKKRLAWLHNMRRNLESAVSITEYPVWAASPVRGIGELPWK